MNGRSLEWMHARMDRWTIIDRWPKQHGDKQIAITQTDRQTSERAAKREFKHTSRQTD